MSFNTNASRLGLATTTENGAAALTTAGAVDFMQSVGERGGALAAMSLHLIGHRGKSYVRQAPPRKVAAPAAPAAGGAAPRRRAKRGGKGKHTGVEKEGTSDANLREFVDGVLEESRALGGSVPALNAVDLLCMAFDVGDVREGKGERNLFVRMLLLLSRHFARTVIASIALIPVGQLARLCLGVERRQRCGGVGLLVVLSRCCNVVLVFQRWDVVERGLSVCCTRCQNTFTGQCVFFSPRHSTCRRPHRAVVVAAPACVVSLLSLCQCGFLLRV